MEKNYLKKWQRDSLKEALPVFREAHRLLHLRQTGRNHLKILVVLEAKISIGMRIAGYIDALNGMAGEW